MKINDSQRVILGPPGCGKTTRVLAEVELALSRGVPPDRIAFVSFTRKAVSEAVERAGKQFGIPSRAFTNFRTVHSLCFRALRMTKQDIMSVENYKDLGDLLGYKFEGTFDESETGLPTGGDAGDQLLFLDNFSRITCKSLRETWENADSGLDWFELERMSRGLREYKEKKLLVDYTDLLSKFVQSNISIPVSLALVDEGQDLSVLQWRVLKSAFRKADNVFVAGDDDQSIYKWSGADLASFLSLEGEKEILSKSYRLPKLVYEKARTIISNVPERFEKPFSPRDETGMIDSLQTLDYAVVDPTETTIFLVRNVFLLARVQNMLKSQGHPYLARHGYSSIKQDHVDAITCWEGLHAGKEMPLKRVQNMYAHMTFGPFLARGAKAKLSGVQEGTFLTFDMLKKDYGVLKYEIWHNALDGIDLQMRAYYLSILHSGRKLTDTPKVTIQTIHGIKGGEGDHVILLPDMSKRTYEQYQKNSADEHRVAYVAVTRAKRKLSIILPSSQRYYGY